MATFWQDWINSGELERIKLMEKLAIIIDNDLKAMDCLIPELILSQKAQILNSYFEDLERELKGVQE